MPALAIFSCLVLNTSLAVQRSDSTPNVPRRSLGSTPVEFPEPFRSIDDLRVLASGDVLITAARRTDVTVRGLVVQMRLYALSFTTGTVRAVGAPGREPGQYWNVGPLLPAPGDTIWMVDAVPARLFVIGPRGDVVGPAPLPPHIMPGQDEGTRSLEFVRTDTAGTFFDVRNAHSPIRSDTHRDSTVVRHRGTGRYAATDTIGWLYRTTRRTPSAFLGFTALPYSLADQWGVAPSGEVVIVRSDEYRVDRIFPTGAAARGAPISYEARPVTSADRDAYINDLRDNARSGGFPDPSDALRRAPWPAFKPPFTGDVVIAPHHVWIPMTPPRDGDPIVYDVVSFDGVLRERVAMPKATTVIGFGPGVVFTARRDGVLVYLGRWPWSPPE